jgi:hypothetical protein
MPSRVPRSLSLNLDIFADDVMNDDVSMDDSFIKLLAMDRLKSPDWTSTTARLTRSSIDGPCQ